MARVLERYFGPRNLADIRYDPYLQELAHKVVDADDAIHILTLAIAAQDQQCPLQDPQVRLRRTLIDFVQVIIKIETRG